MIAQGKTDATSAWFGLSGFFCTLVFVSYFILPFVVRSGLNSDIETLVFSDLYYGLYSDQISYTQRQLEVDEKRLLLFKIPISDNSVTARVRVESGGKLAWIVAGADPYNADVLIIDSNYLVQAGRYLNGRFHGLKSCSINLAAGAGFEYERKKEFWHVRSGKSSCVFPVGDIGQEPYVGMIALKGAAGLEYFSVGDNIISSRWPTQWVWVLTVILLVFALVLGRVSSRFPKNRIILLLVCIQLVISVLPIPNYAFWLIWAIQVYYLGRITTILDQFVVWCMRARFPKSGSLFIAICAMLLFGFTRSGPGSINGNLKTIDKISLSSSDSPTYSVQQKNVNISFSAALTSDGWIAIRMTPYRRGSGFAATLRENLSGEHSFLVLGGKERQGYYSSNGGVRSRVFSNPYFSFSDGGTHTVSLVFENGKQTLSVDNEEVFSADRGWDNGVGWISFSGDSRGSISQVSFESRNGSFEIMNKNTVLFGMGIMVLFIILSFLNRAGLGYGDRPRFLRGGSLMAAGAMYLAVSQPDWISIFSLWTMPVFVLTSLGFAKAIMGNRNVRWDIKIIMFVTAILVANEVMLRIVPNGAAYENIGWPEVASGDQLQWDVDPSLWFTGSFGGIMRSKPNFRHKSVIECGRDRNLVVLGGSVAFGVGITDGAMLEYAALLESYGSSKTMNYDGGKTIELDVYNASYPGATVRHLLHMVRRYELGKCASSVLISSMVNDLMFGSDIPGAESKPQVTGLYIWRDFRTWWQQVRFPDVNRDQVSNTAQYRINLRLLINELQNQGARQIVFMTEDISPLLNDHSFSEERYQGYLKEARELAEETGIQFLQVRDAFNISENTENEWLQYDTVHYTVTGHSYIADYVYSKYLERRIR